MTKQPKKELEPSPHRPVTLAGPLGLRRGFGRQKNKPQVLRELKAFQRLTKQLIPFAPFARDVREITHNVSAGHVQCWTPEAIITLQEACEFKLVEMMSPQTGSQPISSRGNNLDEDNRATDVQSCEKANLSPITHGRSKSSSVSVSTPESLKLKKTRSGRVVVPKLDPGCQSIIYNNGAIRRTMQER